VQYVADIGSIHLIALDSQAVEDGGGAQTGRREWLEQQLAAAPEQPTIVALHRPPFGFGPGTADSTGAEDELVRIATEHDQVERVICGDVHRVDAGELAGRVTITAPSSYLELEPAR
jgi:Icc protein